MLKRQVQEKIQYIAPDGTTFTMHSPPSKTMLRIDGLGLPTVDLKRVGGPYQHGDRILAGILQPRTITANFRWNGCNRDEYWTIRNYMLNKFRFNLTSDPGYYSTVNDPEPGELRFTYKHNGSMVVRSIGAYLADGLVMPPSTDWDEFSVQDTLIFQCPNPIFYDPTPHVVAMNIGNNLINYAGNWEEYPQIVVDGAVTEFNIENTDTGYFLYLDYIAAAGSIITFDLTYGKKTILDNAMADLLSYLTPSSNLLNFAIQPDPIVALGSNNLACATVAGAPTITMTYYDRYTGI